LRSKAGEFVVASLIAGLARLVGLVAVVTRRARLYTDAFVVEMQTPVAPADGDGVAGAGAAEAVLVAFGASAVSEEPAGFAWCHLGLGLGCCADAALGCVGSDTALGGAVGADDIGRVSLQRSVHPVRGARFNAFVVRSATALDQQRVAAFCPVDGEAVARSGPVTLGSTLAVTLAANVVGWAARIFIETAPTLRGAGLFFGPGLCFAPELKPELAILAHLVAAWVGGVGDVGEALRTRPRHASALRFHAAFARDALRGASTGAAGPFLVDDAKVTF